MLWKHCVGGLVPRAQGCLGRSLHSSFLFRPSGLLAFSGSSREGLGGGAEREKSTRTSTSSRQTRRIRLTLEEIFVSGGSSPGLSSPGPDGLLVCPSPTNHRASTLVSESIRPSETFYASNWAVRWLPYVAPITPTMV